MRRRLPDRIEPDLSRAAVGFRGGAAGRLRLDSTPGVSAAPRMSAAQSRAHDAATAAPHNLKEDYSMVILTRRECDPVGNQLSMILMCVCQCVFVTVSD